jgi:3-dehydroquinate dehydratase type II
MQRVLVLHGPNLNLLGERRPDIYGRVTLREVERLCREWGANSGIGVENFQSNHEGDLIDRLHNMRNAAAGVIINAGALTHYSYSLHDAIESVTLPAVEVHISNIHRRESWRRTSVIAPACVASIHGRGIDGYRWAIRHLASRLYWPPETLQYGPEPDQLGDLRIPAGPGPFPVAVLLHGGFWREHWQRDLMDELAVALAGAGVATWNVEYRRVGTGGGWPLTFDDVGAAFDHLRAVAAEHPIALDRIVAVGHSAGGHLALWSAGRRSLQPTDPGAHPIVEPAGVVALAPIIDLAAAHNLGLGDGAVEELLRRAPGDDRYRVAQPPAGAPLPTWIIHGSADEDVPVAGSRRYATADHPGPVEFTELDGVGHMDLIDRRHPALEAVPTAVVAAAGGGGEMPASPAEADLHQ